MTATIHQASVARFHQGGGFRPGGRRRWWDCQIDSDSNRFFVRVDREGVAL